MCWDEGRECFPTFKKIKSRIYGSLKSNFLLRCKFLICHMKVQELSAKSFFASETCEKRYEKRVTVRFLFMTPESECMQKCTETALIFSKLSCRSDWLLKNEPLSSFICVVGSDFVLSVLYHFSLLAINLPWVFPRAQFCLFCTESFYWN